MLEDTGCVQNDQSYRLVSRMAWYLQCHCSGRQSSGRACTRASTLTCGQRVQAGELQEPQHMGAERRSTAARTQITWETICMMCSLLTVLFGWYATRQSIPLNLEERNAGNGLEGSSTPECAWDHPFLPTNTLASVPSRAVLPSRSRSDSSCSMPQAYSSSVISPQV
jgi:hypothetical protein